MRDSFIELCTQYVIKYIPYEKNEIYDQKC
jgi:hypothetical protein